MSDAPCAMCGAPAPAQPCPGCRGPRYCDAACRKADWSQGHAKVCALRYCQRLARTGSPKFHLPGETGCLKPVSLLTIRTEAALPLKEKDEADTFIENKPQGYWAMACEHGLNTYDGLRFVVSCRWDDPPEREPDFLVEGTASNLLLLVHEVAPGVRRCLEDGEGDDDISRKRRGFARALDALDSFGGERTMVLVVRYENRKGRVQARKVKLPCAPSTASTAKPWWSAALAKPALEGLFEQKKVANEAFIRGRRSGKLAGALKGYDSIIAAVETACARPAREAVGPCAATQQLLATCLANRAACRARLGDVEHLQRAEDDCREALEGPFTAWLRQKLDPAAAKLAEKVCSRRRSANEQLYAALGCGGVPPPVPPALDETEIADGLRLCCVPGEGWQDEDDDLDDVAPVVLVTIRPFGVQDPQEPLPLKSEALARVRQSAQTYGFTLVEGYETVEACVSKESYERLRKHCDAICRTSAASAKKHLAAPPAAKGRRPRRAPAPPNQFCPICDTPLAGKRAPRMLAFCAAGHSACAVCRDAWFDVLGAFRRKRACPICRRRAASKSETTPPTSPARKVAPLSPPA